MLPAVSANMSPMRALPLLFGLALLAFVLLRDAKGATGSEWRAASDARMRTNPVRGSILPGLGLLLMGLGVGLRWSIAVVGGGLLTVLLLLAWWRPGGHNDARRST